MENKTNFLFGLTAGIAVISSVGFFVLLGDKLIGGDAGGSRVSGNTVNAPAPTPSPTPTPMPEAAGDVTKIAPVTDDDHIRGDRNAEITMIEYSDFQCPFCQRHVPTLEQVLDEYDGKVRLVYRHLPLNSIHPQAQKAAEASECAAEQGKFWEMHDMLFENQSALDVTSLKRYAGNLGLNQGDFDECLDSGKYASKISAQIAEAEAAGISGTPGTFVNDQLVKGAYPFSTFQQIIDAELAE